MKRKAVSLLALFFAVLLTQAFSCKGSTIHKLTVAEHDFKSVVQAFQDVEIAEFQAGNVEPAIHKKIETGIENVALGGIELDKLIKTNASPQSIKAELDAIYNTLDTLLSEGVLQIKNPKTKATLEVALDSIKALIDNASVLLTK